MAEHDVRWKLPTTRGWPVGIKDMHFRVRADGEVLGSLLVSQGRIAWRPRFGRKGHHLEVSWEDFDDFMRNDGRVAWRPTDDDDFE
jgi:hypothetical protein